jgi:ABC-type uncharacterized transport system involved in gliding motility auxiliary subunit
MELTEGGILMMKNKHASRVRNLLFLALIVLLIAGTFLLNMVCYQLSGRYPLSLDLTANAAFKIGDETITLLESLNKDVEIDVLATQDSFGGSTYLLQVKRILEQYPKYSGRVTVNYVDYVSDPTFASKYPDLTLEQGNILISSGEKLRQLKLSDLFNYTYTQSGNMAIESSRAEEALTSAVINVISEDSVKIAVLNGNGAVEKPAFIKLLADNNFDVEQVNLTTDELDDYEFALLFAPQTDLSEDALKKLDDFLYNKGEYGKTLFYSADVTQKPLAGLEAFLAEWGVGVGDGAVFETEASRTYQYQPYYPIADYSDTTYKDMLIDSSTPVLMPLSRQLSVIFEFKDTNYTETLLSFGASAGVRPSDAQDDFSPADAEVWGPLPALVMASKRITGTDGTVKYRSNVIVSASSAMLDPSAIQNTAIANGEYLLNIFKSLSDRTDFVNIQPKSLAGNTLSVSTSEASLIGILLAGVLPLAILAAGIVIWLSRRYK